MIHMLLDDAAGGTGPKPIELVAVALAGCTAFDVVTVLRQKFHQKVTGYEVRVEADQAERPPQVFTSVRLHHVVTGFEINTAALKEAIRLSEEKYCSVGAMVKQTASLHTTCQIVEEQTAWIKPSAGSDGSLGAIPNWESGRRSGRADRVSEDKADSQLMGGSSPREGFDEICCVQECSGRQLLRGHGFELPTYSASAAGIGTPATHATTSSSLAHWRRTLSAR